DLVPSDGVGLLTFPCPFLAVRVVRLVVDDDDIAPATEELAHDDCRILSCPPLECPEHGGRNELPVSHAVLGYPVLALRFQRHGLPVLDEHIRAELVKILWRHYVEHAVQISFARWIQAVAARATAYAVEHR